MRTQDELIEAILKYDPFQSPASTVETDSSVFTQLTWIQPEVKTGLSPEAKAMLEYWKDCGAKLIAELNNGEKRGAK